MIAGAEGEDADAEKAEAEKKAAAEKAEAEKKAEEEAERKAAEEKLGDAGKAALEAERKARREADKRAKEAEKKVKEHEEAQLSETEKLKKQAEEAEAKVEAATEKARRANLLNTLSDKHELTGAKAKAAARLLDGVDYSDDDEPTNLDDAIKAAKAEYGEEVFKGATPAAGSADQGARDGAKQLSSTEGMTQEEIAKALEEGRLNEYLSKTK
ncbi:MAG: hypothetical protein ACRDNE_00590 [Gaiellaceae bacterium]